MTQVPSSTTNALSFKNNTSCTTGPILAMYNVHKYYMYTSVLYLKRMALNLLSLLLMEVWRTQLAKMARKR